MSWGGMLETFRVFCYSLGILPVPAFGHDFGSRPSCPGPSYRGRAKGPSPPLGCQESTFDLCFLPPLTDLFPYPAGCRDSSSQAAGSYMSVVLTYVGKACHVVLAGARSRDLQVSTPRVGNSHFPPAKACLSRVDLVRWCFVTGLMSVPTFSSSIQRPRSSPRAALDCPWVPAEGAQLTGLGPHGTCGLGPPPLPPLSGEHEDHEDEVSKGGRSSRLKLPF
ncbi:hypothetical protein LZ31DRAFT_351819 [Colletotrichum somersetense]|nr:hypothetical protein LZ31DRAFT_351819 [Colletotrichum somersetense]